MCQIYLLDPGLKLLESNTLKAAVPQNVNDRTYTTACNPANSSKITVREKDGLSQNQPARFPVILFDPWITVTLSLGCQVFAHFLFYVTTRFILAGVSLLEYQPFSLLLFPPEKPDTQITSSLPDDSVRQNVSANRSSFLRILLILILVVSFVYTWTRRNFRLLGESLRGNKTKCS